MVPSQLDLPGRVTDVDGVVLSIHLANGMLSAMRVFAGEHTVNFVFHPWTIVAEVWRQQH